MNTSHKSKKENAHYRLIQKLDPIRFPQMSGMMAAIVGFVLDVTFIEPRLAELTVTSDGFVLGAEEGAVGAPHFLGRYADVLKNWLRLLAAAQLTKQEFIEAQSLFATRIGFFGPVIA